MLTANDRSVFISYSHGDTEHMNWVRDLVRDLRTESFSVVFDQDENPKPMEPSDDASREEKLRYQAGELAAKYLGAAQRSYGVAKGMLIRASPRLPGNIELSPEWETYLKALPVISLVSACRNIVIVNTQRYVDECLPLTENESGEAGWLLEEFQHMLQSLFRDKDRPKRVLIVYRDGDRHPLKASHWRFPAIDFTGKIPYDKSFKILLSYLNDPQGAVDWSKDKKRTRTRVKCYGCDLEIPCTKPPPRVCSNCGSPRPRTRVLCPDCGYNKWHPLQQTTQCCRCGKKKLLWYET